MGWLINLLGKWKAPWLADVLAKFSEFWKGKKTFALGGVTCLQASIGLLDELAKVTDLASLIDLGKSLGDNPDWKMFLAGIAMFTVRAAIKKSGPPESSGGAKG